MKILTIFVTAISMSISATCLAEINKQNFSFKGHKFGEPSITERKQNKKNTKPWEINWIRLELEKPYPKIKVTTENKIENLRFSEYKLSRIDYHHFENKLYQITLEFPPTIGCNSVNEIKTLLEFRYKIKITDQEIKDTHDYQGFFNNQDIFINIICKKSILEEVTNNLSEERVITIKFEDRVANNRAQIYISEILKQNNKDKTDREIKSKINF